MIYESGDMLRHVYFPTTAIVSLLYELENGSSAEPRRKSMPEVGMAVAALYS